MPQKIFIISCLVLIAFSLGDNKNDYNVPVAAYSIYAEDLDLDGDKDIVVGHNFYGISILENTGNGNFILKDSIFLNGWQTNVYAKNITNNSYPDIIGSHFDNDTQYIAILEFSQDSYIKNYYPMNYGISGFITGDINNDTNLDIIVYSNNAQFWGILYNNGQGNFSEPDYYNIDYHPNDIACGNLNEDNREDIVVSGAKVNIYFSYEDGFQLLSIDEGEINIEIADYDLDGDNDIIGLSDLYLVGYAGITFYENLGNNNFYKHEQYDFQPAGSKIVISDLNNDSLPDIVFTSHYPSINGTGIIDTIGGIYIFYNQGNFSLSQPQFIQLENYHETGPRKSFCVDLDNNNYKDIIIKRGGIAQVLTHSVITILYNHGNGNFQDYPVLLNKEIKQQDNINLQCFPNPFTNETTFKFYIKETAQAELFVFNLQGKLITYLTNNIQKGDQFNTIKWDGLDTGGKPCKPGSYIAYLEVNGKIRQTIKIIKLN